MVVPGNDRGGTKLPCLVADSAAFIRNVDLQNLGDHIFTVKEVVHEIRDAATKQRLSVLPYELDFREPSAESLYFVTEFSKKTGDYKSLSAVDLRVLALTHQLEKEYCSVEHIKLEPSKKIEIVPKAKVTSDKEIAGFYFESKHEKLVEKNDVEMVEESDNVLEQGNDEQQRKEKDNVESNLENLVEKNDVEMVEERHNILEQVNDDQQRKEKDIDNHGDGNDDDDDNEDEDNENDDDDGVDADDENGWITPGNIQKVKQTFATCNEIKIEDGNVKCACLTTDFAMQNVLIQMGLHVLSVQGMLIRQARNYIQKCFGCYKETHDMVRIFCPSCGNKTLKKISVTLGEDGTMQYHYPKRTRNFNIRGTKFSIPAPKGGRIVDSILLAEDQPMGRNRMPRARDKANPLDQDYVARTNPFSVNDVNSRAFMLGLHVKHRQAKNPNENKKKKTSRKK